MVENVFFFGDININKRYLYLIYICFKISEYDSAAYSKISDSTVIGIIFIRYFLYTVSLKSLYIDIFFISLGDLFENLKNLIPL